MIICPIHPRHHTRLNPAGISQFARFRHIRDQCRLHHICQRANHGNTPRSVPFTIKSHLVLIGANTIVFRLAIVVEGSSTLATLKVRLGKQHIHILCRLNQHRETPTGVEGIHDLRTTKATQCLHFTCRRHWEKALIAIAPLLYPAACTLWNGVNRLLTLQLFAFQSRQLIAECHTIVVKTEHQLHRLAILVGILTHILIRHILRMESLTLLHQVVSLHLSTLHNTLKSKILPHCRSSDAHL